MTFSEDLMLYQEEVIRQFIEDQASMKVIIHQKDELINQLYKQISELQEYRNASQLSDGAFSPLFSSTITLNRTVANNLPLALQLAVPPPPQPTNIAALGTNTVFSNTNAHPSVQSAITHLPHSAHELQAIADREFNIADRDGDGRISRDEWRQWIMDKHNLLSEHNHVKSVLMSEIRNLRKALNPNTTEIFSEIKKTEESYKAVEEELVKLYIERDTLKAEFSQLQEKYAEMEVERTLVENDWEERYNALLNNLGARSTHATLNGDKGGVNPYAYNYQEDRALGLDTSNLLHPRSGDIGSGESVPGRPETPGYQNLDLVNLASANLATLGSNSSAIPAGSSNANPNTHMIYIPANPLDGNISAGTSQAGHSYAYYSSTEEKRRDSPHTIMTTTTNTNYHPPSQSETHISRDAVRYYDDHKLDSQQQYPQNEIYYAQQLAAQAPYAATLGEGYGGQNGMYWMSHQGMQDLSHPLRAALKYDIQARQAAPTPGASPYTTVLLKKVLKDRGRSGFEPLAGSRTTPVPMSSQGRQSSPPRGSSPQRFMQKTDSWAKKSLNPADKDKRDKDSESEKDMARGVVNWK
ncbi:hypothetical protein EON65_31980 [archaeon]|nr:MAG: hypothetical protein EON65_31980 [archaeon]